MRRCRKAAHQIQKQDQRSDLRSLRSLTKTKDGIIIRDRWGQEKPHPATVIEKEARAHLLQSLKALNLDLDSLEG